MARKLTEIHKKEILEGFRAGRSVADLSKDYACTPATITRSVKTFVTEQEYLKLKEKRKKDRLIEKKLIESSSLLEKEISKKDSSSEDSIKESLDKDKNPSIIHEKIRENDISLPKEEEKQSEIITEIAPLSLEPFSEEQKEVALVQLKEEVLPQIVYMIIDKKTEPKPVGVKKT